MQSLRSNLLSNPYTDNLASTVPSPSNVGPLNSLTDSLISYLRHLYVLDNALKWDEELQHPQSIYFVWTDSFTNEGDRPLAFNHVRYEIICVLDNLAILLGCLGDSLRAEDSNKLSPHPALESPSHSQVSEDTSQSFNKRVDTDSSDGDNLRDAVNFYREAYWCVQEILKLQNDLPMNKHYYPADLSFEHLACLTKLFVASAYMTRYSIQSCIDESGYCSDSLSAICKQISVELRYTTETYGQYSSNEKITALREVLLPVLNQSLQCYEALTYIHLSEGHKKEIEENRACVSHFKLQKIALLKAKEILENTDETDDDAVSESSATTLDRKETETSTSPTQPGFTSMSITPQNLRKRVEIALSETREGLKGSKIIINEEEEYFDETPTPDDISPKKRISPAEIPGVKPRHEDMEPFDVFSREKRRAKIAVFSEGVKARFVELIKRRNAVYRMNSVVYLMEGSISQGWRRKHLTPNLLLTWVKNFVGRGAQQFMDLQVTQLKVNQEHCETVIDDLKKKAGPPPAREKARTLQHIHVEGSTRGFQSVHRELTELAPVIEKGESVNHRIACKIQNKSLMMREMSSKLNWNEELGDFTPEDKFFQENQASILMLCQLVENLDLRVLKIKQEEYRLLNTDSAMAKLRAEYAWISEEIDRCNGIVDKIESIADQLNENHYHEGYARYLRQIQKISENTYLIDNVQRMIHEGLDFYSKVKGKLDKLITVLKKPAETSFSKSSGRLV